MKRFVHTCVAAFLLPCSWCYAANLQVEWEIQGRYRLLKDASDEAILFKVAHAIDHIQGRNEFDQLAAQTRATAKVNASVPSNAFGFPRMPRTFYDPQTRSYSADYVRRPSKWAILATVTGAKPGDQCTWILDDIDIGRGTCSKFLLPEISADGHRLSARIGKQLAPSVILNPKDILVVGLGDSFGSGEGAPDVPSQKHLWATALFGGAKWLDRQCHRSLVGWESLIAARLAADSPHSSVTFVSRACSGAEVRHIYANCNNNLLASSEDGCFDGAGDPQAANESPAYAASLPPQIEHLRDDLCLSRNGDLCLEIRKPDVALLSIGGNDAQFGPVILKTLTSNVATPQGLKPKIERAGVDGIEKLRVSYPKMMRALLDDEKGFGSEIKIILPLYPNPTFRNKQTFCGLDKTPKTGDKLLHIVNGPLKFLLNGESQNELIAIADDFIHQITGAVVNHPEDMTNGKRYGLRQIGIGLKCMTNKSESMPWNDDDPIEVSKRPQCRDYWGTYGFTESRPVGALHLVFLRNVDENAKQENGFEFNGYCLGNNDSSGRWINTVEDSFRKQGTLSGSVHPNIYGQMFYAKRTWPVLRALTTAK